MESAEVEGTWKVVPSAAKDEGESPSTTSVGEELVFASLVQSSFLPPKRATIDCNRSRTDPDIAGTELDHLGLVFCGPWN